MASPHRWKIAAGLGAGVVGLALLRELFGVESRLHQIDVRGFVAASASGLARAAGVSLPVYVLASAMQSEEKTDRGRLAVGRTILNAVRERPGNVPSKLMPSGHLGSQLVNPYASTARPPTARTLSLAQAIADGRVPDFVDHAVQWDSPAAQDRNHALYLEDPARYPKYRLSSAEVAARRRAAGMREVHVPGVPDTRFWARA